MISVVVPVFNSENTLSELINRISKVLGNIEKQVYEIILVDDNSKDDSWNKILEISKIIKNVKGIRLRKNVGQQIATLIGIQKSKGSIIITIDDDLQHPPEELPNLINKLDNSIDVIYGVPKIEKRSFLRNFFSIFFKLFLQNILSIKHANTINSFRLFRKSLLNFSEIKGVSNDIDALLFYATNNFEYVKVENHKRKKNLSGYKFFSLISYALNMLVGFSVTPLRFAFLISIIFLLFGFCMLIFVFLDYFISENPVPGFAFISSLILIFSGIQIFLIGIIGEYVARIFLNSSSITTDIIKEETEFV